MDENISSIISQILNEALFASTLATALIAQLLRQGAMSSADIEELVSDTNRLLAKRRAAEPDSAASIAYIQSRLRNLMSSCADGSGSGHSH